MKIKTDIDRLLNEPRDDLFYRYGSKNDTLESVEAVAREHLMNGPEGNDAALRLITIIRALIAEIEAIP